MLTYIRKALYDEDNSGYRRNGLRYVRAHLGEAVRNAFSVKRAAGVVYGGVEELIPEMSAGEHSHVGTVLFAAGFTVMMTFDWRWDKETRG